MLCSVLCAKLIYLLDATPLREITCHVGSHTVICHPIEVAFPHSGLLQPLMISVHIRPSFCQKRYLFPRLLSNVNFFVLTYCRCVISVPPKIEYDAKYKQPVALNAGATLTLPVTVSGVPTPNVAWYFGEKELKPGNGTAIETKEKAFTLTIKNTSGANAGEYRVKAENSAGSDEAVFKVSMKG